MDVYLIHGQGRSWLSMTLLGHRLKRAGHHPRYFNYWVSSQSFNSIRARLMDWLPHKTNAKPYIIIGHSLGNILTRSCLPDLQHLPLHLIMLAPPNQPAKVARIMSGVSLYRILTSECGRNLGDSNFYKTLTVPNIPTTIFAGTAGPKGRFSLFKSEANDGIVSVEETRLDGREHHVEVASIHTLIMNSKEVTRAIVSLLASL